MKTSGTREAGEEGLRVSGTAGTSERGRSRAKEVGGARGVDRWEVGVVCG